MRNTPLDDDFVTCARIYSPDIRFGKDKFGIGSSREEIEEAFKGFQEIIDVECGFIDGETWLGFYFDENQRVNEIVMYYGS